MEPISRRRLLIGGGTAVTLATVAAVNWDDTSRLWWRVPGVDKPRKDGEVDHRGAHWIAASEANLRSADRPADYVIDRVVIHVTQSDFRTAVKVFRDPLHASAAHYVVRASDGRTVQMVRELDVAYHAGNRSYNERSIGIEHEGFVDRPQNFTEAMYLSSARLTADICKRYGIPVDRGHIVGHNEVPGADHTDPGPHWDWKRYIRYVREARDASSGSGSGSSGKASPGKA
ncbi:N-acetylmuramoyl-L-alanine amidase [Streptomyces nanshensis]|uniref:N-acetylmuramoyl-L-alanine amidase n=1 Tax=Streptomyces nanshensis TaxID=518642 RepID=A0A1E7L1T9_9ACTN|nr:N-acetylmuramoyl-L-alanine amidase [Streptomyces nanshensis]OEV10122.1 N-acetylmuramoyl-L-alanine amidase [Streptomyces nanshensis]